MQYEVAAKQRTMSLYVPCGLHLHMHLISKQLVPGRKLKRGSLKRGRLSYRRSVGLQLAVVLDSPTVLLLAWGTTKICISLGESCLRAYSSSFFVATCYSRSSYCSQPILREASSFVPKGNYCDRLLFTPQPDLKGLHEHTACGLFA